MIPIMTREKFNSKINSGIKRSIHTAAVLAFVVPISLELLFNANYIIHYKKEFHQNVCRMIISNEGRTSIHSAIFNFDYQDQYLLDYSTQDNLLQTEVSEVGREDFKGEDDNELTKFRTSLKIENLPKNKNITIDFKFKDKVTNFDIIDISSDRDATVYSDLNAMKIRV